MGLSVFLIIFSAVMAFLLPIVKKDRARSLIVCISAAVIAAGSIAAAAMQLRSGVEYFASGSMAVRYIMLVLETALAVYIAVIGIRRRKYTAPLLAVVQCGLMIWFELRYGRGLEVQFNMYADQLTAIMILITGIIGSLICVFASGSIRGVGSVGDTEDAGNSGTDEANGNSENAAVAGNAGNIGNAGNRQMLSGLYLSMAAMFGLVSSSNMAWMYFFWQVSAIAVFLLMRGERPKSAEKKAEEQEKAEGKAFRSLAAHLLSGLFFVIGIVILGIVFGTLEISTMLIYGSVYGELAAIPAAFLAVASFIKSGQMPFHGWLRAVGTSPAPAFAMVHSFGPAAAGAFLIIRMAPLFGMSNFAGIMVMMVGGITFLFASLAAISCNDFKDTAAYSTAALMGLAAACGGIGTAEAVWAGILLLIFHAIAKGLLVICLDQAGRGLGGTRREELEGSISRMPALSVCMIIASAGIFLAPLGMLVSQWQALSSAAGSGNFLLMGLICFGIAAAAYSQSRWIGIMAGPAFANLPEAAEDEPETAHDAEMKIEKDEAEAEMTAPVTDRRGGFVRNALTVLMLLFSLLPMLISKYAVVPYLENAFDGVTASLISTGNMIIAAAMLAVLILLGAGSFARTGKRTAEKAETDGTDAVAEETVKTAVEDAAAEESVKPEPEDDAAEVEKETTADEVETAEVETAEVETEAPADATETEEAPAETSADEDEFEEKRIDVRRLMAVTAESLTEKEAEKAEDITNTEDISETEPGTEAESEGDTETVESESSAEGESPAEVEPAEEGTSEEESPAESEPFEDNPAAFLRDFFNERRMVLSGGILNGVMMIIGISFIVTSLVSLLGGAAS